MAKRSSDMLDGHDDGGPATKASRPSIDAINHNMDDVLIGVLLQVNGSCKEVKTSINNLNQIFAHSWKFLGGWEANDVVIIVRGDQNNMKLPINQSKLQPPFHKSVIRGDIFLIKTNGTDGVRLDYTLKEYEEFLSEEIEESELQENQEDNDEDEEEDDDEDDDDDGEENGEENGEGEEREGGEEEDDEEGDDDEDADAAEEAALLENILDNAIDDCTNELKRNLSGNEKELIASVIDSCSEELKNLDPDDDENTDFDRINENIKAKLIAAFKLEHNRNPNKDESLIIGTTISRVIVSALAEGNDTDEDGNLDADKEGSVDSSVLYSSIFEQLLSEFENHHGRVPTEAELNEIKQEAESVIAELNLDHSEGVIGGLANEDEDEDAEEIDGDEGVEYDEDQDEEDGVE